MKVDVSFTNCIPNTYDTKVLFSLSPFKSKSSAHRGVINEAHSRKCFSIFYASRHNTNICLMVCFSSLILLHTEFFHCSLTTYFRVCPFKETDTKKRLDEKNQGDDFFLVVTTNDYKIIFFGMVGIQCLNFEVCLLRSNYI